MEVNKDKLVSYGAYSAFVAVIIFLVGTTLAMLFYPEYDFMNQMLSELGIRVAVFFPQVGEVNAAPFPEIFNVTLMLTSICLLPFLPVSYFMLKPKRTIRKTLQIIISLGGVAVATLLFLVGVFDVGTFSILHIGVALCLYFCFIGIWLLWGIAILALNKDSPYKQSKLWIVDPIVSFMGIFVGVINAGLFGLYEVFTVFLPYAFYQKLLVYLFLGFFGYVAIRFVLIQKTGMDNHSEKTL
jgi:hypothetical membrane protein